MWLHVEPTSRCQAWCPSCTRNILGYGLSDFVIEDLDPDILKQTIDEFRNLYPVNEIFAVTAINDFEKRLRSYELLSEICWT